MIQRHQRIVFWCLVACILGMGVLLAVERQRGRARIEAMGDATPLDAPTAMTEAVTLDLANDMDGTITVNSRQIALPGEANAIVWAVLLVKTAWTFWEPVRVTRMLSAVPEASPAQPIKRCVASGAAETVTLVP